MGRLRAIIRTVRVDVRQLGRSCERAHGLYDGTEKFVEKAEANVVVQKNNDWGLN